jgi:hypothetical protein
MKHSDADHTDIDSTKSLQVTKKIAVKPHPQLLILMFIPRFMHDKYRGSGRKSLMEIVLRYGTKVNLNQ